MYDLDLLDKVQGFISSLDYEPIILKNEPNEGRVLLEKFVECSNDSGYAIILMIGDDLGSKKGSSNLKPRPRQNVIFEYGYFAGKLGRNSVCVIMEKDIEYPTDLSGVVRIDKDDWTIQLKKELDNWNTKRIT